MTGAADAALIGAMVLTKLLQSIDDLAWFMPFVAYNKFHCVVYVMMMLFISICAIGLGLGVGEAIEEASKDGTYWTAERILGLAGGIILFFFSLYLLKEYLEDDDDDEDEDEQDSSKKGIIYEFDEFPGKKTTNTEIELGEAGASNTKTDKSEESSTVGVAQTENSDVNVRVYSMSGDEYRDPNDTTPVEKKKTSQLTEEQRKEQKADLKRKRDAKQYSVFRFVVVCILGSLDDLILQSTLIISGTLKWWHLLIGNFLGSTISAFINLFVSYLGPLVRCLQMIPLFVIIFLFSVLCLVSTFA